MKKTVLLYGILGGVLIAALKIVEYHFLVLEHSLEIYGGIVAALFSVVGIWLGQKLTRRRVELVVREVPASAVPLAPRQMATRTRGPSVRRRVSNRFQGWMVG